MTKYKHPWYYSWRAMKGRCDRGGPGYDGVTYCPEWASSDQFYVDMGDRPPGTSLDRINSEMGYFPENCRWATRQEQTDNRPDYNIMLEGLNLKQWCDKLEMKYHTVYSRMRRGQTMEQALGKK